jgi:hypothetical protein
VVRNSGGIAGGCKLGEFGVHDIECVGDEPDGEAVLAALVVVDSDAAVELEADAVVLLATVMALVHVAVRDAMAVALVLAKGPEKPIGRLDIFMWSLALLLFRDTTGSD